MLLFRRRRLAKLLVAAYLLLFEMYVWEYYYQKEGVSGSAIVPTVMFTSTRNETINEDEDDNNKATEDNDRGPVDHDSLRILKTLPETETETSISQHVVPPDSPRATSATTSTACSCYNTTTAVDCCQRKLLSAHKFGVLASQDLFWPYTWKTGQTRRDRPEWPREEWQIHQLVGGRFDTSFPTTDYRHVMIIRNLYDALVSGYLYHKAGHECTIKPASNEPIRKPGKWVEDWDAVFVVNTTKNQSMLPPRNNRTLCEYLQDESEVNGMYAYMRWSMVVDSYATLVPYARKTVEQYYRDSMHKSLFVCYEVLANETTKQQLFSTAMDFWFPGGRPDNMSMSRNEIYNRHKEGHSTNPDPVLRSQLRQVVRQLDEMVFDNEIKEIQDFFGCGEKDTN